MLKKTQHSMQEFSRSQLQLEREIMEKTTLVELNVGTLVVIGME